MRRFLPSADFVIGAFFGMMTFLFIIGVLSYQSDHCRKGDASTQSGPNAKSDPSGDKNAIPALSEDGEREEAVTKYAESHPWVCGIAGFPRMMVGTMDHHEGFFVGAFTLALFGATFFLWRSTEKLWAAGERQIEHVKLSAVSAEQATKVARDALTASNRAWIKLKIARDVKLTFFNNILTGNISLEIENIGNYPAIGISILLVPFVDYEEGINHGKWAENKSAKLREFESQSNEIMFPGDVFPPKTGGAFSYGFNVQMRDIEKGLSYGKIFEQDGFVLRILVCVNYRFPGEARNHQTRKFISINGRNGGWLSLNEISSFDVIPPAITSSIFNSDNTFGMGDMAD